MQSDHVLEKLNFDLLTPGSGDGGERGSVGKIFATMLLHSCFPLMWYATWSCFVCFVALPPKSTAMVIAGRSVHLTTLFPGQAGTRGWPVIRAHTFACNWQQPFLNESAEGKRVIVEIISWSTSTKVWDQTGIELATPGSAVRHASVARHITDCATRPSKQQHDHVLKELNFYVLTPPSKSTQGVWHRPSIKNRVWFVSYLL